MSWRHALLALLLVGPCAARSEPTYFASAFVGSQVGQRGTTDFHTSTEGGERGHSAAALVSDALAGIGYAFNGAASASAFFGRLGALAVVQQDRLNAFGGDFTLGGNASAFASFEDDLTIVSPTTPAAYLALEFAFSGSVDLVRIDRESTQAFGSFRAAVDDVEVVANQTGTISFNFRLDPSRAVHRLVAELYADATSAPNAFQIAYAQADFSHTLLLTRLSVLDADLVRIPDAAVVALSGTTYGANAAPEPATALLAGVALLLLAGRLEPAVAARAARQVGPRRAA